MDQGSVVVLRRRAFLSAEIPGHPDMDRDLSYSGSIPTATTSDPRPVGIRRHTRIEPSQESCVSTPTGQGSVLVVKGREMTPCFFQPEVVPIK